jgi:hypothetical protein
MRDAILLASFFILLTSIFPGLGLYKQRRLSGGAKQVTRFAKEQSKKPADFLKRAGF